MKAIKISALALALSSVSSIGLAADEPAKNPAHSRPLADILAKAPASDWRPLDPQNTLYLELPAGRVVMELAPAYSPKHADNIKTLVREKYFDGLAIIRSQDNYVVQWGDPEEDEAKSKPFGSAQAKVDPEFTVPISAQTPFSRHPDSDGYAPQSGFSNGFPVGRDPEKNQTWLAHCYGAVGVARGNDPRSGNGSGLYVIIGHAPRHLDRNIAVVGRVVQGIEHLSTLPRGTGPLGFYEKPEQRVGIEAIRLAADVPMEERTLLEVLRTDTDSFAAVAEARRNRIDDWSIVPAGHIDLCNVQIPVRPIKK